MAWSEKHTRWALLGSPVLLAAGFLVLIFSPAAEPANAWIEAPRAPRPDPVLRPRPALVKRARLSPKSPLAQLNQRDLRAIRETLELTPKTFASAGFGPIPPPEVGDWRLGPGKDEEHQTWQLYVRAEPNGSRGRRRRLVMRRVGPCSKRLQAHFEPLRQWMAAFFQRPVSWGAPMALPDAGRLRRLSDGTKWRQHHTGAILRSLRYRVPADAAALLGVTCKDLYPEPSWNFVFGMATFRARVGIYSLARLYPTFVGETWTADAARLGLLRAFKLLTHEAGHMFGVHHCTTFHCVMNGSNGMDESDGAPLNLCPLCLSKLAWNLKWSSRPELRRRYAALARLLKGYGLDHEAGWYARQAQRLSAR